jgi:rhamnulokinase
MTGQTFVAFDLGAESGRSILGSLDSSRLSIRQLTRFPNEMRSLDGHLHWDVDALFGELKNGLRACAAAGAQPVSVGVDTWGVDFGFLDHEGKVLEQPYSYRDHRTDGMMEQFFERVPRQRIYELTGIQFMQLNTLFQLFAARQLDPGLMERVDRLLFMPDLFNYLLSGVSGGEYTIATTSQLMNPRTRTWEPELFKGLEIPVSMMQPILNPGTKLGKLKEDIATAASLHDVSVTAVAAHDTGSAIAAIPADGENWAYISSGTWSLMGVEIATPILSTDAMDLNFTNEGGVGGKIRFLKNIMGLWLLQQCRKDWSEVARYDYEGLVRLSEQAEPFRTFIDPDCPGFFNPERMTEEIRKYSRETQQLSPETHAHFVRCILESLALKYRVTLDQLRRLTAKKIERIHVIGGGAQNSTLCQFAANAMGLPVVAGPVEATAIGNILVQALAHGSIASLQDIRAVVANSFSPVRYEPIGTEAWEEAYQRFVHISSSMQEQPR